VEGVRRCGRGTAGWVQLVMCMAQPEAVSRAKPGQNRLGRAGPNWGLREGFGPACHEAKPEPGRQATAFWRANFVSPPVNPSPWRLRSQGKRTAQTPPRHENKKNISHSGQNDDEVKLALSQLMRCNTTSGDRGSHTSQTSVETSADPDTYPTR
jgi:hypothetical protein